MIYIYLLLSIILLILSGNIFITGSISVSKNLNVPMMIIGLTVVSIGTSAPEAAVSISAALSGVSVLAINNIIGSNLVNILVAMGLCAIILPFKIDKKTIKFDYPISIIATVLMTAFIFISKGINRLEGIILFILFIGFMIKVVIDGKKENIPEDESINNNHLPLWRGIIYTILGIVGVALGGHFTISNTVLVAEALNISNTFVGLTILAIGTSLPEIITTVISAYKKEVDLAIGNVVGSNIFNILFVLSSTAIIKPVKITSFAYQDSIILLSVVLITFLIMFLRKKINRSVGILMVISYIAYIAYISIR